MRLEAIWRDGIGWRAVCRLALVGAIAAGLAGCARAGDEAAPARAGAGGAEDAAPSAPAELEPTPLEPGRGLERALAPGEAHEYLVSLEHGDYFALEVEQKGVDVGLSLFDPRSRLVLEVDLPIADLGAELLLGVAERSGGHRLRVEAWESEDPSGSYSVVLSERRPADDVDRLRARAAMSFYQGERLSWDREDRRALVPYAESLELWRQAGDQFWQAETLDRIGTSHRRLGDWESASRFHRRAVAAFERLADPIFLAVSSGHLAMDHFELGELEPAIRQYTRTLDLQRQLGDRRGQGMSLGALANIFKVQGETQAALDSFQQALGLLDRPEDRLYRAAQLHNLGTLYRRLGKHESAFEHLRQAERIYAGLGDPRRQASSLSQLGQLAFESGNAPRALQMLGRSLDLRRRQRDRRGEAVALRKIGSIHLAEGDLPRAREHYLRALELLAELESPRTEAAVLAELGELHNRLGKSAEALAFYRRALAIHDRVGDPVGEASCLLGVAVAERAAGRLGAALAAGQQALDLIESLRLKPYSDDLRLSFFATVQRFFDTHIDLLMTADRAEPAAGHGARALEVSERARARSLLDLLTEAGAELRDDAAPQLLERERAAQRRLNRSIEIMEDEEASDRRRTAAAAAVQQALERLDAVRSAIRRESPRYAALTQPLPLRAADIQRRLLDRETVLLEYRLGAERSFAWLVTSDRLAAFELPPAAEIESAVRRVHALLAQGPRRENEGQSRALLCELGQLLLAPMAGRLGNKRLAIVADGALEYLPFAALPDPDSAAGCSQAEPLVVAHEIVHLPSASALAALRREQAGRASPAGLIAVLADPVFSPADERVAGAGTAPADVAAAAAGRGKTAATAPGAFRRLPHSRAEAEAILGLAPSGLSFRALGFDASREVVLSGKLAGYRIVHFATHGLLNAEQPELSGLALSQVDREGRPVEGFLRAHEIYNLRLPADLVVLGGCETALGKVVRGEGLVGLTRGFMYAGASRVMVSLWQVSDRGTADLMTAFYRQLLAGGLAPAAALRQAQLELRSRRPQPFYWAGFIIQGDWWAGVPRRSE